MTKTSAERREYIRQNFKLRDMGGTWMATQAYQGKVVASRAGNDKRKLVDMVRRDWGHFNFDDEADEFNKIFPVQS